MASVVKLEATIMKSGYLIKLAKGSGRNWKKRYFMLNGNTITYYVDHNSIDKAKGDLLLTAESTVEDCTKDGKPHCLVITTPFHTLVLAAKDVEERDAWKKAVEDSIRQARHSIRGYITKKGGLVDGGKSRKFFILHENAITYHQDHEHTSAIQGMMKLTAETAIALNDAQNKITLTDTTTGTVLGLRFESSTYEYNLWKKGILKILNKYAAAEKKTVERIENAYENAIKRGKLRMRPAKGGDIWDEYYFVLTNSEVLVMEKNDEGQMEVIDLYEIHPNCSVFETNLGHYAFELVTSKKVLHVMSDSRESTNSWIQAIRGAISNSSPEEDDPLLNAAMAKMEEDIFYDVSFHEDKPLGVVLERSGEWAIVKLSNVRDTGVSIGSALSSINGEPVILKSYQQTIDKLKNWRPPLHLGFRKAPRKTGYLVKLSRQRRGNTQKNWKERFFILDEGRLVYKENESADAAVKGDVPLMGSAVSLVSSVETGKFFCFRLVSGVTSLVMQALTMDEMMDWASTLYHAIAVANGGGHILASERKRVEQEQERQRLKEEALRAKAKAEEEARIAREQAEAKARAEEAARLRAQQEEAARRAAMAEEERLKLEAAEMKARKLADATAMLTSAMEMEDVATIEAAIATVSEMDIASEVSELASARALVADIQAKEAAAQKAREDALAALTAAQSSATVTDYEALGAALSKAEDVGVSDATVDAARAQFLSLKREKAMQDEVTALLEQAMAYSVIGGLEEALQSAKSMGFQTPLVASAEAMLQNLQQEAQRAREEEQKRLAEEAAALDAELAAQAAADAAAGVTEAAVNEAAEEVETLTVNEMSDNEMDEEEVEAIYAAEEASQDTGAYDDTDTTVTGASEETGDTSIRSRIGGKRKLASRSSRLARERAPKTPEKMEASSVTDEDLQKVFEAYARRTTGGQLGQLNPMQFSTIWRLITGDKGNLFKEMQTFNKFDADNNGALDIKNFIAGWRELATRPDGFILVEKMKSLVGEDNMIL